MADESNVVMRTIGYWKQFYKTDRRGKLLLEMVIMENGYSDGTKMNHGDIEAQMKIRASKCLHDASGVSGKK